MLLGPPGGRDYRSRSRCAGLESRPDGVFYTLKSPRLREGETELRSEFVKTGEYAGTGSLHVDGKKVAETEMPKMHISTYSLAETFDVGRDTGTQVSRLYEGPFPFQGGLDRVAVKLTE